ncbi:hypothetical protein [Gluconobacter oxydans]|uniref:hypothetical protein n=1 Tax=Gluconobacter oxydans TaxID=442 RepID=UPI0011D049A7|nr:hypothetical protein [Gluconobacter oxydans]
MKKAVWALVLLALAETAGATPTDQDALSAKFGGDATCRELARFFRDHQPATALQVQRNHQFYLHLMEDDGRFPKKIAEERYWEIISDFQQECAQRPDDPIGLDMNDVAVKMGIFDSH